MALGSKSDFFFQDKETLDYRRFQLRQYLEIKGYDNRKIEYYEESFDYFVLNPDKFDGATATEDLEDIIGLELPAMDHDFDYHVLGVNGSKKYMRKSDRKLKMEMRKLGKSSLETSWRLFRLFILREIVMWPLWNGKKMNGNQKRLFDKKYKEMGY